MLPRNFRREGLSFAEKGEFLKQQRIRFAVGSAAVLEPIFKPFIDDRASSCGTTVFRFGDPYPFERPA
jgi:hypothetical protein